MKEFWNQLLTKLKELWTSFRAWKYSNIALWSAAGVAVTAVAVVIVLCAVGPKGNDNPTLPTGGSSMDGTNPTGGENNDNGGSADNNGGSTDNNGGSSNNGGSTDNGGSNNGGSNNGGSNNGGSNNGGSNNNGGGSAKPPVVDNDNTNSDAPPAPESTVDQTKNIVAVKTATAGGAVTAHPGGRLTYTISITNNNKDAIGVTVTDTLPEGTSLVRGCSDVNGKTMTWKVNSIAAGKTHKIIYTVKPEYTIKQVRESTTDIIIKNTAAKVQDKEIAAPSKDIYVLETFNAEDRRKMEMAIDALVTANLTANKKATPYNSLTLISAMYTTGFSAGAGFGATDPGEALTMIFEKAGQGGSGSTGGGGVEDVVDTASNLLNRVAPTLYGGTKVPASKDSLFRGARATSVSAADLISGDVLLVGKGSDAKAYIYDGTYLVEVGTTKVTTNITPATVLNTLSSADQWAVIRLSIDFNITFALNEDEYFNDADKNGYTLLEQQMIATAEAYLLRGDRNQYTDDMMGTGQFRWQSATKLPEDCTIDQYGYSNCAAFTYDVQWATYGYAPKAKNTSGSSVSLNTTSNLASSAAYGWNAETLTGTNKSTVFYCRPQIKNETTGKYESAMTPEEQAKTKELIISLLRPGDIICIRRTTGTGHAMLYAGNGTIIHSSGSSYSDDYDRETHEATIRFRMVEDLFDPTIYNTSSYVFNLVSFSIVRPQNLKTNPTATENTLNRVNNMKGIVAEKVTSTAMGKTVNPGDTITYTFYVFNTNKDAKTVEIKDVLSEHVTFASATNGGSCSGSNISWKLTVPAETRISVSYTVKVKDGVAAYTAIDGTKATINGVMHRCPNTYVVNTLTAAQQQQLVNAVNTVKGMDLTGKNSVDIAELIYKTAFGVDDLFGEEVTNFSMLLDGGNNQSSSSLVKGKDNVGVFNDAWYWESSNKTTVALMNHNTSKPAMMVAPGMWGGHLVMNSTYNKNNRDERFTRYLGMNGEVLRSRLFWEKDLVVGDIFLMKGVSSEWMFIYIGNDKFVTISAGTTYTAFQEVSVAALFQYAPHDTWKKLAILRPSFQLDI